VIASLVLSFDITVIIVTMAIALANAAHIGEQKMAPATGGLFVKVQVRSPSFEVTASAEVFEAKSPPPTIPFSESRNATEIAHALGELTSGVSYVSKTPEGCR
jgi:hypothetical protein